MEIVRQVDSMKGERKLNRAAQRRARMQRLADAVETNLLAAAATSGEDGRFQTELSQRLSDDLAGTPTPSEVAEALLGDPERTGAIL